REASIFVVAPATADFMARVAHGHADDLLTACLLANSSPVLLVPAMNDRMWANAQTVRNTRHLRELGYDVLDPDTGPLAAGEGQGPGRMPEPEAIMTRIARMLEQTGSLRGKRVVVTAGATREPIDPVRFISNHSSGRMGIAIAEAAWRRGADVTLIAGHLEVPVGAPVEVRHAETTATMRDAVESAIGSADVLVMAAAPADYRPVRIASQKIKKGSGSAPVIELEHTDDILKSTIAARKAGAVIVGFALETENLVEHGEAKLLDKKLDLIVVNSATEEGAGFRTDTNRVTILGRDGASESIPLMQKTELADVILDRVESLLNGR
ncbi:MAG TPA: bifunctional phosphopantothenoylcysteine decarboxylase/phosphopantothenate--cysteine ligase CoaBC, partial [Gemmatimonadaceae bacterium]|nr:bifunctional phosphopantothenoylcysteine decarboxylase/phosphopantothenate--cysteine ligase CoaBC [Gemmatimonadaceae bacterium]